MFIIIYIYYVYVYNSVRSTNIYTTKKTPKINLSVFDIIYLYYCVAPGACANDTSRSITA